MSVEKKIMYLVSDYDEPQEVCVLLDDDKVIAYGREKALLLSTKVEKGTQLFDTEAQARDFLKSKTPQLDGVDIKGYIWYLYRSDRLHEVLNERMIELIDREDSELNVPWEELDKIRMALSGVLNIGATSFMVSDVSCVKYGKDWLSVILKDGTKITPKTETEIFIIESIFGKNQGRWHYPSIVNPLQD